MFQEVVKNVVVVEVLEVVEEDFQHLQVDESLVYVGVVDLDQVVQELDELETDESEPLLALGACLNVEATSIENADEGGEICRVELELVVVLLDGVALVMVLLVSLFRGLVDDELVQDTQREVDGVEVHLGLIFQFREEDLLGVVLLELIDEVGQVQVRVLFCVVGGVLEDIDDYVLDIVENLVLFQAVVIGIEDQLEKLESLFLVEVFILLVLVVGFLDTLESEQFEDYFGD